MAPPSRKSGKIYDKLLEFFASAVFQMPVLNFIDQNCMIFVTEDVDTPEYRDVHLQYKSLVSALIGAFCEDSGMKYEDFISALSEFSDHAKGFEGTALKAVYEQVLASENYTLFVNLMLRHNVELQQQCLLLILKEIGNLPPSVIAAATGASVETLHALVSTAQGGGGATPLGPSEGKSIEPGHKDKKPPEDQELAILMAALKDSSLKDQPEPPSQKTPTSNAAPSNKQTTKTKQETSSSSSETVPTVEKVAEIVDKMADKRAGYDKKVEQNLNGSVPPVHEPEHDNSAIPVFDNSNSKEAMMDEAEPLASKSQPSASKPQPSPSKAQTEAPAAATSSSSSGTSMMNLPPLPSGGPLAPGLLGKGAAGGDLASMSKISSMLQPLGDDSGNAKYGEGSRTNELLKKESTQRALEAIKNMNADDLVARSEYLKAQRDRLIALKKNQRKTVLDEEAKKQSARPRTARISKQLVEDDKPAASAMSPEDEERLRVRRAINESIRREMMASKDK